MRYASVPLINFWITAILITWFPKYTMSVVYNH